MAIINVPATGRLSLGDPTSGEAGAGSLIGAGGFTR